MNKFINKKEMLEYKENIRLLYKLIRKLNSYIFVGSEYDKISKERINDEIDIIFSVIINIKKIINQ